MYDWKLMTATSFGLVPLFAVIIWMANVLSWQQNVTLRWYDQVTALILVSAGGSALWPFYYATRFVSRLSEKVLTINFYAHPRDSIMARGPFLATIALVAIFVDAAGVLWIFLMPIEAPVWLYGVMVAFLIWFVAWFLLTQRGVHKVMVNEKHRRMDSISKHVMVSLDLVVADPSQKNKALYDN